MTIIEQIKNSTQLRWNRVHKFKNKIPMTLECGPYVIKTAETYHELYESFRLRDEVFNQEFRNQQKKSLDFDRFDYFFDHLIIIHRETKKIIGTYRLNCTTFSTESYTGLEFDLDFLKSCRGPHLELGRACIHKQYRKGSVISLLWRGIAEYMILSESNILFGCSSAKINNPRDAALAFKYLKENNHITSEFRTYPTFHYQMVAFENWLYFFQNNLSESQINEAEKLIPSLLKSYLKLGAKIACAPAFDKEFDCIDFLTILKKEDLSNSLAQKFQLER